MFDISRNEKCLLCYGPDIDERRILLTMGPLASGMVHHLGTSKRFTAIIAPSGNSEGVRKILPLVQQLNVNFKNMNPPYPFISSAIQLKLGRQGTKSSKKSTPKQLLDVRTGIPQDTLHFHSLTCFPILYGLSEKMAKKCSPFPPHSLPCFLKQQNLEQSDGWGFILLQFSVHCLSTWRAEKLGWDKQPLTTAPGSPGKVPYGLWREKLYGQLSLSTGPTFLFFTQRKCAVVSDHFDALQHMCTL